MFLIHRSALLFCPPFQESGRHLLCWPNGSLDPTRDDIRIPSHVPPSMPPVFPKLQTAPNLSPAIDFASWIIRKIWLQAIWLQALPKPIYLAEQPAGAKPLHGLVEYGTRATGSDPDQKMDRDKQCSRTSSCGRDDGCLRLFHVRAGEFTYHALYPNLHHNRAEGCESYPRFHKGSKHFLGIKGGDLEKHLDRESENRILSHLFSFSSSISFHSILPILWLLHRSVAA